MSETAPTQDSLQRPTLGLQKIFLKDASLESPMGVLAFQQNWAPKFHHELQVRFAHLQNNFHEVILTITLKALLEEGKKTAFIVEIQQAGVFDVGTDQEKIRKHMLNVACPALLFPYAREAIDSLVLKAGFPAPNIPPINFEVLYQEAQQQKQSADKTH